MERNAFPTKGNLIRARNNLALARLGYELLDKKRMILAGELAEQKHRAEEAGRLAEAVFGQAYAALRQGYVEMGRENVAKMGECVPEDESLQIDTKSIMGVEFPVGWSLGNPPVQSGIPDAGYGASANPQANPKIDLNHWLDNTTAALDMAVIEFSKAKEAIAELAVAETAVCKLEQGLKRTGKRANALQNITIPKYEARVKAIRQTLEEMERDEFVRVKVAARG